MYILAIDTSCDETSVAICKNDCVISNKISSQIELHKKWGGVVPGIAKRMHQENIDFVLQDALHQARMSLEDIDAFAVTIGPGLAIALEVGIAKAKELATTYGKPFIGINHMEGHIYSALGKNSRGVGAKSYTFPLVALLISGGHTEIVLMRSHGQYAILGKTLDDAVGEAYDKVARMLELGYPGGPIIEQLARNGDATRFTFPIPMSKNTTLDMSYSGLKTSLLYFVQREVLPQKGVVTPAEYKQIICDVCAGFQNSVIQSLTGKLSKALRLAECESVADIVVAGGVSANTALRRVLRKEFGPTYSIHFPINNKMYGDNAGMIGIAAYFNALRGNYTDPSSVDRSPNLSLPSC